MKLVNLFEKKQEPLSEETIKKMVLDAEYYRTGSNGYPEDKIRALDLYEKAAKYGNTYSQLIAGYSYDFGDGVAKNSKLAIKYYRDASESGNCDATLNLANIYSSDRHGLKDKNMAIRYYKLAIEQGSVVALSNLAGIYMQQCLDGERSKEEAVAMAKPLLEKAESSGYINADYWLNYGVLNADIGKNDIAAVSFVKAVDADNGNQNAQFMLAKHRFFGRGTDMDLEDARSRFQWLADTYNDKDAINFLSWYTQFDKFRDTIDAVAEYMKADRFGDGYHLFFNKINGSSLVLFFSATICSKINNLQVQVREDWIKYSDSVSKLKQVFDKVESDPSDEGECFSYEKDSFSNFYQEFLFDSKIDAYIKNTIKEKFEHINPYTEFTINPNNECFIEVRK